MAMHRGRVLLVGIASIGLIAAGGAQADTAQWIPTFPVEPGTATAVDATPQGQAAVVLLLSGTGGLVWTPATAQPPQGGSSNTLVALENGSTLFTENGQAVARSTNGATSWTTLSTPRVTKSKFFEFGVSVSAAHVGRALDVGWSGSEVVDQQGGIPCPYPLKTTPVLISHDDGNHWSVAKIAAPGWVEAVRWNGPRDALAEVVEFTYTPTSISGNSCGYTGADSASSLWVTHDGGLHWKRSLRCIAPDLCDHVAWVTPTTAIAVDEDGSSYISADRGNSFRRGPQVFTPLVKDVGFVQGIGFGPAQSGRGWVDTNGNGIYRTDDSGKSWTWEHSVQDGLGDGVGTFAVIDALRAIAAGPKAVLTRAGTSTPAPLSPSVDSAALPAIVATLHPAPGVTVTVDARGQRHIVVALTR